MVTNERNRKLVEVALPLEAINSACRADKGRAHGTIKNIHKWFAPMPVPAWRALLFASLIDDPADSERRAVLLDVIARLVASGADVPGPEVIAAAKAILGTQYPGELPIVIDPFCGGGSTLIEGQRLGLESAGFDLNPVPVLITRTLTDLLPKVSGFEALRRDPGIREWLQGGMSEPEAAPDMLWTEPSAGTGLDAFVGDVLALAGLIRTRVANAVASTYGDAGGNGEVAWLWARTVTCPNPACGTSTVLSTTWWLSKRKGDLAWIQPTATDGGVSLHVISGQETGGPPDPPKVGRGAAFACLVCGSPVPDEYVSAEGIAGRIGLRMTCVVGDWDGRRTYRQPTADEEALALSVSPPVGVADVPLPNIPRWFSGPRFGMKTQADLYTSRQLNLLAHFAEAIRVVYDELLQKSVHKDHAVALVTVLGLGLGRLAQFSSMQARWTVRENVTSFEGAFPRNDVPMTWDFYEINALGAVGPTWMQAFNSITRAFRNVVLGASGSARLGDARNISATSPALVATDPPYFEAIGYADLSDYFYVWHRLALRQVHPDLYATVAAPRAGELTAIAARHEGDADAARKYFIEGFTETFRNLQALSDPRLPLIVVYASKEQKGGREEETRWSSILTAMVAADLEITGTWPILGTTDRRMISQGTNSVATYVAMVCRPRRSDAGLCSLADFNRSLRRELKVAVRDLQAAGILPVDLAQAAMGPGMQIYSRYGAVMDQAGNRVPVDEALRLINSALGEVLDDQEGELDAASRFAVAWYEQHGWDAGRFDLADKMVRPKGIAVEDLVQADVITLAPGRVWLKGRGDLDRTWLPSSDKHPTAWEAVHHLADRLMDGGGSQDAGQLMAVLGIWRDPAQSLVYRLHDIAAKNGWTKDQEKYNALIASWSDLLQVAATAASHGDDGGVLF